jgi:hypothetical protein
MREVLIGQTNYTVLVRITGTDGAPETGLTEASIDIAYARVETDNDVTTSDVTPASLASLTAAHSDWGFIEVSATDHPGLYRLDIADAVFATGAWEAVVTITDASGTDFYAHDVGFRLVAKSLGTATDAAALFNAIADHVRRRTQANVEASSDGDTLGVTSEYGAIQAMLESNLVDNPGSLTIYKTDGTTELAQRPVTTDPAAEPITGIS